jgi:drug/metabolite transporter (DMT)-like permease
MAWVGMTVAAVGVALASGPELTGAVSARPVVLASIAAVGFGLSLYLLDRGARVSLLHTLWGMRLTSVTVFVIAALALRTVGGGRARDLPMLAINGGGDLLANALFAFASSRGMVSVASVLGSLYPVVTVLLARAVLEERLRRVQVAGVALSLAGVVVIAM